MAKYVFVNIPAIGHVNPTLAVVRELVERGEEVVYYLTAEFQATIEATGATFRPYRPFMMKPPTGAGSPDGGRPGGANGGGNPGGPNGGGYPGGANGGNFNGGQAGAPGGAGPAHLGAAFGPNGGKPGGPSPLKENIVEMLEQVRADKPDVIIYDAMHLWARTIAEILQVPALLSCPMFVANEHFNPLKEHFNLLNGKVSVPSPIPPAALQRIQAAITEVRDSYNLPPFDMRDFFAYTAPLNIVYIPRDFHPSGEVFDERFVFVGPSLLQHDIVPLATDKELQEQPTLYISLGTVFNERVEFFKLCFEAFGDTQWQVVLAHGSRVSAEDLGPAPENFQLAPYVEQFRVLPRSSVFLTHGGMSSAMESLYYGVPMVALPQSDEQSLTAHRITELGAGLTLDVENLSVESLREAVERVQSEMTFRSEARVLQQTVRAAGGYRAAADALMAFVKQHAPVVHS